MAVSRYETTCATLFEVISNKLFAEIAVVASKQADNC